MWWRILGAIVFTAVFAVLGFFAFVISTFLSTQNGYIYVCIVFAALIITGNLLILGMLARLSKSVKFFVPVLIFFIPIVSYAGYEAYIDKIEIKNAEVDLKAYEPFLENSKIALLDEESTLKLSDQLPKLDGATALYPVYSAFVRAVYPKGQYEYRNPNKSPVVATKTIRAYERLASGEADMIFAAMPSSSQRLMLSPEVKLTPIGKEAFVFFVHTSNPVENLTLEQLQHIYAGEITNWKTLGGRNQEIIAFQRPEGSGSQTGLVNMMGDIPLMDPPKTRVVGGMGGIIKKASDYRNYRNAIGFSYRYFATEMITDKNIKFLKVNGVYPDVGSIQSGEYPLTGEFYAVTNGSENPHIEPFLEWILSKQGQSLIEKTGYVPIRDFD